MHRTIGTSDWATGLLCAWFLLAAPASALTTDEARHLLLRAGLGPTPAEVRSLQAATLEDVLDRWLTTPGPVRPPAFASEPPWQPPEVWRAMSDDERRAYRQLQNRYRQELKDWWFHQLVTTSSPLHERMTLFWHGHFTSSLEKVATPVLMYRQNLLFREHALGNFADLLRAVARDPAMLIYLDNRFNRKDHPNENFARELLEVFTLGEGHYEEADVKSAARAFTGWTTHRHEGAFVFNLAAHDVAEKRFLGITGPLSGEDVIDRLLASPRTAEHVVTRLWREFVSPTPDAEQVRRWATEWREQGYDIAPLMRRILASEPFWNPQNRGTLVKSPVEFVVGTLRLLDLSPVYTPSPANAARAQGQDLFDPPNVKGWPDGVEWIDAQTLLGRDTFIRQTLRGKSMQKARMLDDAPRRRSLEAVIGDRGLEELETILFAVPATRAPDPAADPVEQLAQLLLDPAWNLK